jgi:hypothetical protein
MCAIERHGNQRERESDGGGGLDWPRALFAADGIDRREAGEPSASVDR